MLYAGAGVKSWPTDAICPERILIFPEVYLYAFENVPLSNKRVDISKYRSHMNLVDVCMKVVGLAKNS